MHPVVYKEYEKIVSKRNVTGSVLEVGAIPNQLSLLNMRSLVNASEKIGINLDGPYDCKTFTIVKGNSNSMDCFEDNRFDVALCNALLEHDKHFWKTISEIKRVTKPGGFIVIGSPGYTTLMAEKVKPFLKQIPEIRDLFIHPYLNALFTGTITLHIHEAPGDYYRFSPQAFKEVILEGLNDVQITSIMLPPRIIGSGIKPKAG